MPSWVLRFPDLGEGLDDGELTAWLVSEGEEVAVDQPVCEVHTNKVSSELSSPHAGTVMTLHVDVGDRLRLGDPLLTLELAGPLPGVVGVVPGPAAEERRVHLRTRPEN